MNSMLCIYEDAKYSNLYPLSLTRPVFELRCGIFSLGEKLVRHFPGVKVTYLVRDAIRELVKEQHSDFSGNKIPEENTYFVNARLILHESLPKDLSRSTAFRVNNEIVGAFVARADLAKIRFSGEGLIDESAFEKFDTVEISGHTIHYPWDLVHHNGEEISSDFKFMGRGGHILGKVYPNVTFLEQANIYLAPGAKIYPGVVIDGESGPVYIAEGATVMANAVIQGPVYIGKNSRIKIGAKIYEGTSIGEVCKVGGEVEESIVHGFSNKQHEGFLGHAYLGEWVNLGADTNNSDLKNNYGHVKVMINGSMVDSGSMFVGLFMGDHSKSGINTMFNTGTSVGVMCNVFGAGYPPKFIPSFTWGGIDRQERYDFNKAVETARRVMERRQKTLSTAQEQLLRELFERSEHQSI